MKRALVAVLPLLAACASAPVVPGGWTAAGFEAPESACVDIAAGAIFVSNVSGQPGEKDGKGWISKLDLAGNVQSAKWVQGFNAPKGLRSLGGKLWVADIDEVASIDIPTAKIDRRIKIEGAKFLNDVAVGLDGTVYVSDMALSRIYAIKDESVAIFADGPELEHPNGLLVEGGSLVVGGWGKPEPDFSTKLPGRLYRLDLTSKKKTLITPEPTGNLDGVESDGKGGYIVSDWISGKIYRIAADGATRVVAQHGKGAADLAYVPASRVLILPHMMDGKVGAYVLK
jgi:hypothetical protein